MTDTTMPGVQAAPAIGQQDPALALLRQYRNVGDELSVDVEEEAQAAISADINAILKRLEEGMPRLFEDMKAVQCSLRRPLGV